MRVCRSLAEWPPDGPTAVTIGKFDGVHRGHQALLAGARATGRPVVAVTFDRHPIEVLQPGMEAFVLTPLEDKLRLLERYGADAALVLPVTPEFLAWSPAEFVDRVLVERLQASVVFVGPYFRFGRSQEGDSALLRELLEPRAARVEVVPPVRDGEERVSSSRIAAALAAGDVDAARRMLGRPYTVCGPVVEGRRLGHTLGWPTANLTPPARQHLPASGVYAAWASVAGEMRVAAVNIGVRPTVDGTRLAVEAHLLNWQGDLYGQDLELAFVVRLRGEQRFESLEALKAQIEADVARVREMLGGAAPPG